MGTFRILSLDGGGIRGIYTIALVKRIADRYPEFLDKIDMFAGTSTGSILALGLAHGFTPAEGIALYRKFGAEVFRDSRLDNLMDLFNVVGAEYDNKHLKRLLQEQFGNDTLGDLREKGNLVIVPAFDLDAIYDEVRTWKPKFFHNFPGDDSDEAEKIADVALRSAAAPTYFPSYQGYIDGGVIANSPSMAALIQVLSAENVTYGLHQICVLSVGAGLAPRFIQGDELDWGYAQWAKLLVPLFMDGSMGMAHYQCRTLLRDRYHRLAPSLPEPVDLDDTDRLDDLVAFANGVKLGDTFDWVENHFLRED